MNGKHKSDTDTKTAGVNLSAVRKGKPMYYKLIEDVKTVKGFKMNKYMMV